MSERRNGVLVIDRDPLAVRLMKEPHILIAGTTGSGKSTMLNTLLYTMATFPTNELAYSVIDLKKVSLKRWKKDPHIEKYASSPKEAMELLHDFEYTMQNRYAKIEKTDKDYFEGTALYLIIEEAAELLDTVKGAKDIIKSLARLGRAANIHVILCSQSPNRKTIPADLTLNFTARLALRCQSAIESRQVIGYKGAEGLPRYGTGLYSCPDLMQPEEVTINLTPDKEIDILLTELNQIMNSHKPQKADLKMIWNKLRKQLNI